MERIYHTWDKWECYPAGFYETKPPQKDMEIDECKQAYADFLRDSERFRHAGLQVLLEWPNSCEHYLTNERMNRIAWVGQSAMCWETGISKYFCGGYFLLSKVEQQEADEIALGVLSIWASENGYEPLTMGQAASKTQADLY
jgi:hypothetical protein